MEVLSEQTLVSCEADCDGCNGGFPYKAMDWVSTTLVLSWYLP